MTMLHIPDMKKVSDDATKEERKEMFKDYVEDLLRSNGIINKKNEMIWDAHQDSIINYER